MKKLILLLSIPLMAFQCEPEQTNNCNCFEEVVWFNNGNELVIIERKQVSSHKCELWGYGDEYLPMQNSEFWKRFKCE